MYCICLSTLNNNKPKSSTLLMKLETLAIILERCMCRVRLEMSVVNRMDFFKIAFNKHYASDTVIVNVIEGFPTDRPTQIFILKRNVPLTQCKLVLFIN